jgi:hypothetical protein
MATTFTSDIITAGQKSRTAGIGNMKTITATREAASALVINDVLQMVPVPRGAVVHHIELVTDDLDTDGSPGVVLDVGDGDNPDRYIDGSTVGQDGGRHNVPLLSMGSYVYPQEDTIDILVAVAPVATGTGTLQLTVTYFDPGDRRAAAP